MSTFRTTRERAALSGRNVAAVVHLVVQALEVVATIRVLFEVHRRRRELHNVHARDPAVK